jgi:tRNA 2-selenouridine synthase SelU
MSFEKQATAQPVEAQAENRLDLTTVCPDRAAVEHYNVGRADKNIDVNELLKTNDVIVAQATNHWNNIITKFNRLPDQYKHDLVQSFAPHMYGDNENYPMYNRLVDAHAQSHERIATV